jgi:hypothetical protein
MALTPITGASAFSTESGGVNSDGSSQIADPDEALDQIADPGAGASGDVTIETPSRGSGASVDSSSSSSTTETQPSLLTSPSTNGN